MKKMLHAFAIAVLLQAAAAGCTLFGPGDVDSRLQQESTGRGAGGRFWLNQTVNFGGETCYLCAELGKPLPDVVLAFTLKENGDRSLPKRMRGYLLRLQEGKPIDAIRLEHYGNWYLADITGDGRDEVIVASAHSDVVPGLRVAPGIRVKKMSDFICMKLGRDRSAKRYGVTGRQFGESPACTVVVYRVGKRFEKLFEDTEGYHHASSSFARTRDEAKIDRPVASYWFYYPAWADLFGTGLPVHCTVVIHRENRCSAEGEKYTVYSQELVSYWAPDSKTGKWHKIEAKRTIDIEQDEPDLDALKGILVSPPSDASSGSSGK